MTLQKSKRHITPFLRKGEFPTWGTENFNTQEQKGDWKKNQPSKAAGWGESLAEQQAWW